MSRLSLFNPAEYLVNPAIPDNMLSIGVGTINPIGIPLERLFRWLYQVRKWKITATVECTATNEAASASLSYSNFVFTNRYDPTDEARLTIPFIGNNYMYSLGDASVNSIPYVAEIAGHINWQFAPVGVVYNSRIAYDGALYYPPMIVDILIGARADSAIGAGHSEKTCIIGLQVDPPEIATSTEVIKIDGIDVTFLRYDFASDTGSGASTSISITDIKVDPSEFWPHDDGTGPAYDSVTGAYLL